MLNKRKILISSLLSTLILTNNSFAQEVNCGVNGCYVNLDKITPSKRHYKPSNSFKKIQQPRFLQTAKNNELRVTHQETYIETINLATNKYRQQRGEYLEPESELERNTIILAPQKYVMSYEERELYNEQQNQRAKTNLNQEPISLENRLIEPELPMSLYYCKNNSEPIYNLELDKFQCII